MFRLPMSTARVLAIALTLTVKANGAVLDHVGVMGDSLSSEFLGGLGYVQTIPLFGGKFQSYENWVEILATRRGVNFGSYGFWGSNRREGYQFNQASVFDVTTSRLLTQGQDVSLRNLNPTLAVLMVGGNDFFFHLQDHALPIFGGDGQDPQVIVASMLTRFTSAINTVAGTIATPTGVEMILATVPDLTRVPSAVLFEPLALPGTVGRYRSAIESFNSGVRSLATARGFGVLDLYEGFNDILGPIGSPSTVTIAGVDSMPPFHRSKSQRICSLAMAFIPTQHSMRSLRER